MNRAALMRKLEVMLDDCGQSRTWGQIEIELRDGQPTLLRKTITERLDGDRERTHARYENNNHR
jgi:hypothetical protein